MSTVSSRGFVRAGLVAAFAWGCQGDPVSASDAASDAASEAGDAASDGAADAGRCDVPGNLVRNPSFETVAGGGVSSWPNFLVSKTGGAHDCDRYVEWRTADSDLAEQSNINLPAEAPVGATFELSAWVETLDGNTDPIVLYLEGAKDSYESKPTVALSTTWKRVSAEFVLTKPTTQLTVAFRVGGPVPTRVVGIDLVALVRK